MPGKAANDDASTIQVWWHGVTGSYKEVENPKHRKQQGEEVVAMKYLHSC